MQKFFFGLFLAVLLTGCGKEAPPVYTDSEGNAVEANAYPPAYDAQIGN